jgi:lipopolysaccharide transport system permease protein
LAYPLSRKLRIEPPTTWRGLDVAELWRYRELLYFFVWRDIKVRYKQTALGATWAIVQPLATTVLFAVFFGRLGGLSRQVDQPYSVFLYVALSLWTFFSTAVVVSANSLVGSSHLISKVYFPRVLVPISAIVSPLVDFAVAFAFLIVLLLFYGITPSPQIVALPVFVLGAVACAAGAGIMLAALIVSYRDFRYVLMFAMQLWLFATPVLYPLTIIPERWRPLYALNPMVGMVTGARAVVFGEPLPALEILVSFSAALFILLIGVRYFLKVERRFADVI